jgi:hypothetical protein
VDDQAQMTPDEIVRTLADVERIEPFEMTDAERAAIQVDRQARYVKNSRPGGQYGRAVTLRSINAIGALVFVRLRSQGLSG